MGTLSSVLSFIVLDPSYHLKKVIRTGINHIHITPKTNILPKDNEAFNEIDVAREKKILLNIFKYLSDKTIIVVSHRFDNKNLFDRTLTLKNGRIDEEKL